MKKLMFWSLGLSIMIGFYGCDSLNDLPKLDFLEFSVGECHSKIIDGRYVINNEEIYMEVMPDFLADSLEMPSCSNASPPSIDFGRHTLLGYRCVVLVVKPFFQGLYFWMKPIKNTFIEYW